MLGEAGGFGELGGFGEFGGYASLACLAGSAEKSPKLAKLAILGRFWPPAGSSRSQAGSR